MASCVTCGQKIVRKRRNPIEKVLDRATYLCESCDRTLHVRRSIFSVFRRYCECPGCGTRQLTRLARRDGIDRMTHNPLRHMLVIFGAPLYHCTFCRFQFWDWRKRAPEDR